MVREGGCKLTKSNSKCGGCGHGRLCLAKKEGMGRGPSFISCSCAHHKEAFAKLTTAEMELAGLKVFRATFDRSHALWVPSASLVAERPNGADLCLLRVPAVVGESQQSLQALEGLKILKASSAADVGVLSHYVSEAKSLNARG